MILLEFLAMLDESTNVSSIVSSSNPKSSNPMDRVAVLSPLSVIEWPGRWK